MKNQQITYKGVSYTVNLYDQIQQASEAGWRTFVPANIVPLGVEYLKALEESCPSNVRQQYVVITKGSEIVAVSLFQLIDFTVKGLGLSASIERILQFFKIYDTRKPVPVLLCGNTFFSGNYGYYFAKSVDGQTAYNLLNAVIDKFFDTHPSFNFVAVKDFVEPFDIEATVLKQLGYTTFAVDPCMVFEGPDVYETFDGYIDAIISKYKKRYRSIAKKGLELRTVDFSEDDIQHNAAVIGVLFNNVQGKAGFKFTEADVRYMMSLKKNLGEKYLFRAYYLENIMVGFLSAIISDDLLEAHFIGVDYQYNHKYEVYQNLLYDFLKLGIEYKVQRINYGRTAMEIKSNIGAKAHVAHIYIKHRNKFLNWLISPVFGMVKQTKWTPRDPFKNIILDENTEKNCSIKLLLSRADRRLQKQGRAE